jgi:UDP-N-acetylmuramate dehydrogenase
VLRLRRAKGMVIDPADPDSVSVGSFFTNPVLDADAFAALRGRAAERLGADTPPPAWPDADGQVKTSAAWLIERAGFHRGHGNPEGIAISSKHTLALTNRGGATTDELDLLLETRGPKVLPSFCVIPGWRERSSGSMGHQDDLST